QNCKMESHLVYGFLVISWVDHVFQDYDSGFEHATAGRDILRKQAASTGFPFLKILRSFELCVAGCQLKNRHRLVENAMAFYENILKTNKNNIEALE
ncbi:hypothetical protein BGZ65_001103, partial [Modicella reniformis]